MSSGRTSASPAGGQGAGAGSPWLRMCLLPFAVCLSSLPFHAACGADLSFSSLHPGRILDRDAPDAPGCRVRTRTAWGRRLGDATAIDAWGRTLPDYGLDRSGGWNALRLGTQPGAPLVVPSAVIPTNGPFTVSLWFRPSGEDVLGPWQDGMKRESIVLAAVSPRERAGFRLYYIRSSWCRDGRMVFQWFVPQGGNPDGLQASEMPCASGFWHHAVLASESDAVSCYLDGRLVARRAEGPVAVSPLARVLELGGRSGGTSNPHVVDTRIDACAIRATADTPDEVRAAWEAGRPVLDGAEAEAAEAGLLAEPLPPDLPAGLFGYLDRPPAHPCIVEEGVRCVVLTNTAASGLARRVRRLPFVVLPRRPANPAIGVEEAARRQPESAALGIRFSRVAIDWARLEPAPGAYDWRFADATLDAERTAGRAVVLRLSGRPRWVGRDPRTGLPADLAAWRKAWGLLAARYRDVAAIEFDGFLLRPPRTATPEDRRMHRATLLALWTDLAPLFRSRAPEARLLVDLPDAWTDPAAANDLFRSLDPAPDLLGVETPSADRLRSIRGKTLGPVPGMVSTPVWDIGGGPAGTPSDLVRQLVRERAAGVALSFLAHGPSVPDGDPASPATGIPGDRGRAVAAYGAAIPADATLEPADPPAPGWEAWRIRLPGDSSDAWVFLADDAPQDVSFPIPAGCDATDLFGSPLPPGRTSDIVYLSRPQDPASPQEIPSP
jgi:hypothetical protein